MKEARLPEDETTRLQALRALNVLDTPPEERFDRLVRMAARMFDVPVAYISFIDERRQWLKAAVGIELGEIAREDSICAHAILEDGPMIISDLATDGRFADGPMVLGDTYARFYAAVPLELGNGYRVGTLCIIDDHPRSLEAVDVRLLNDLGATVEHELKSLQREITDTLTGILNRHGFKLVAEHSLNICVRQDLPATLAYLDLSEFKAINESFGHEEGDRVLTDIAGHLKSECRPSDIFARLGADKFVALFINAPVDSAEGIMARFRRLLRQSNQRNDAGYECRFNYGIVEYDFRQHKFIDKLLHDGAEAMNSTLRAEEDVTAA